MEIAKKMKDLEHGPSN